MNWGIRIVIICSGFVVFMTFLVVSAFRQNFDLVAEDYYGKELKFQQQIDKQKNQQNLKENIRITSSDNNVVIQFPVEFSDKNISGDIIFFRPSDATKDVVMKISLDNGAQKFDKSKFTKGLYRIQIDYKAAGKDYYFEDSIII